MTAFTHPWLGDSRFPFDPIMSLGLKISQNGPLDSINIYIYCYIFTISMLNFWLVGRPCQTDFPCILTQIKSVTMLTHVNPRRKNMFGCLEISRSFFFSFFQFKVWGVSSIICASSWNCQSERRVSSSRFGHHNFHQFQSRLKDGDLTQPLYSEWCLHSRFLPLVQTFGGWLLVVETWRHVLGHHGLVNVGMAMSIWELDSLDPKLDPYF